MSNNSDSEINFDNTELSSKKIFLKKWISSWFKRK